MLVWYWLIAISQPEALEWVFTIADEIPVFVDTVSEFKAGKIKHWSSAYSHPETHSKGAGNFVGTSDHQTMTDRNAGSECVASARC